MTQKQFIKMVVIHGWQPIQTNRGCVDFGKLKLYAYFSFKDHPRYECMVADSRIEEFKKQVGL